MQVARAAYQPKLPKSLKGTVHIKEGAPTQSVANQEEIAALFPNTYGMPVLTFEADGEEKSYPAINVGVILCHSRSFRWHQENESRFPAVRIPFGTGRAYRS